MVYTTPWARPSQCLVALREKRRHAHTGRYSPTRSRPQPIGRLAKKPQNNQKRIVASPHHTSETYQASERHHQHWTWLDWTSDAGAESDDSSTGRSACIRPCPLTVAWPSQNLTMDPAEEQTHQDGGSQGCTVTNVKLLILTKASSKSIFT